MSSPNLPFLPGVGALCPPNSSHSSAVLSKRFLDNRPSRALQNAANAWVSPWRR